METLIMEGSEEADCSKTSPSDRIEDQEESEENNNINGHKPKDGSGSSSNSTIEENEKKTLVRPYVRSKTPRLRWTNDLHLRFVQAVERLGGQERATPKLVLEMMDIKELSIAHVKSHLQMYRSKKIDDASQVVAYHSGGGSDRNIYNLSQLPMLQGSNQMHHSTLRYAGTDASRVASYHDEKWIPSPFMDINSINRSRPKFYNTVGERIFGSNYRFSRIPSINQQSEWRIHEPNHELFASNSMKLNSLSTPLHLKVCEQSSMIKRKATNCDLDLNLSLGLKARSEEDGKNKVENELRLSLYSPASTIKTRRLNSTEDKSKEIKATRASTLDLTI